jgi:hypothetical protein
MSAKRLTTHHEGLALAVASIVRMSALALGTPSCFNPSTHGCGDRIVADWVVHRQRCQWQAHSPEDPSALSPCVLSLKKAPLFDSKRGAKV